MARVDVAAGVCGFHTQIAASADAHFDVSLAITSDCGRVRELAQKLTQLSALQELAVPITEANTYRLAARCRLHTACPVPAAILKAVEVAAGMALPADVQMVIRRE